MDEYLNQFKSEQLELIVRIKWCAKKGDGRIPAAGFDRALNVKTGELFGIGSVANNCLMCSPSEDKYGYKLREGKLYHILVREKISKGDDKYIAYYLDKVLERNVKELRLHPVYEFESDFEEQTSDMIILTEKQINGGAFGAKYRMRKCTFSCSIDMNTNKTSKKAGTVYWIEHDIPLIHKFNFKEMRTYHIKVRKSKTIDNCYMLCNVLKKVTDERMERAKEDLKKAIIINDSLGKFELNRNFNYFKGKIDYLGELCTVYLNVDFGAITADYQLDRLYDIYRELAKWDASVKEYVSDELLDLANEEWLDDADEITREEFIQRIGNPDITIEPSGTVRFMFNSDEIFTDHGIEAVVDRNGNFISADIVG